ncbi:MAG: SAP domain-containing protein [Pseudomonadota bacterium]
MKIQQIREIARPWGVDVRIGRSKQDIIRDIQIREGYSPCFGTKEICDYDCLWKTDCLNNAKKR